MCKFHHRKKTKAEPIRLNLRKLTANVEFLISGFRYFGKLISHINARSLKISLHSDETTDVSNWSQLIALVRYVHDSTIKNFLFWEKLKITTKSKHVFQFVKDFFAKHEMDIQSIGSLWTDGTHSRIDNSSKCSNCYGPRAFGDPWSSVINLIYYILWKTFFSLKSQYFANFG